MQNAASLPGELGSLEGWRLAFLAVAIPGLPLALLFLTFTEPSRKEASSEASGASGTAWTYIRANYATIALLFTGLVFAEFAINATIAWSPTILIRSFSVSLSDAGVWFGGLMTAASVVSIIIASLLSRYAVPRFGETSLLPMVWVSLVVAAVALCASSFVNSYQAFMLVVGLFFVAGFVSGPFAPTLTIMVAPNQLRGRLVGLYYAYSLAVQSAAPVTIGLMSDHVFEGAGGLRTALVLTATAALSLSLACLLNTKKPLHATLARLAQKAA
jgi:MFS family permease